MYSPPNVSTVLKLAWPVIVSRMSQTFIGLSDVLLVTKLGEAAIAATSTGSTDSFSLMILPMGTVFIVQSFAAQLFGRGMVSAARNYGWYGIIIALVTQVVSSAAILGVDSALALLPMEPNLRALLSSYMAIRLWSMGPAVGIEALGSYFGGLGRTQPAMVANVVAMSLNILLAVLLIWGKFGLPAMGVAGAALASTIATWVAFIGLFVYFLYEGRGQRVSLKGAELKRVLRFGLPSGINWFFEFGAYLFFLNVVVVDLGTVALAAWSSVIVLNSLSFMPAFGMASAGAVVVGQAIGANQKDDVPRIVKMVLKLTMSWQAAVGVIYLLIPQLVLHAFLPPENQDKFMSIGANMLMVSAAWQVFDSTATTLAEALRAAGDTVFPLFARLAIAWGVFVPGSLLSLKWLNFSEVGSTAWMVIYLGLLAALLVFRFSTGQWRNMQLVEVEVAEMAPAE